MCQFRVGILVMQLHCDVPVTHRSNMLPSYIFILSVIEEDAALCFVQFTLATD